MSLKTLPSILNIFNDTLHLKISSRLNQFITITHHSKNVCVIFTKDFSLIIGIIVYPLARSV